MIHVLVEAVKSTKNVVGNNRVEEFKDFESENSLREEKYE